MTNDAAGVTLVLTIMNMDTKAEYKRHELLIQKAYEAFCGRQKELIKEEIDYYSPHVAEQYLDPWIERMQQSDFHRVTMDPDFEGDDEEF